MWIIYLADKLKAGVMIACPSERGANGFAATSSWGPAALWMMPEMPLPASNDGLADITIISLRAVRIFLTRTEQFKGLRMEVFTFVLLNDMF